MDNGQHEENSLIKSSVQYGQTDTKSSSKPEEEKEEELSELPPAEYDLVSGVLHRRLRREDYDLKNKAQTVDKRVSCKIFSAARNEGFLFKRKDPSSKSSSWLKRWCVIKKNIMYIYESEKDRKTEISIFIPSFQVSPIEEMQNQKYAFRISNDGCDLVFAAESKDEAELWIGQLSLCIEEFLKDSESSDKTRKYKFGISGTHIASSQDDAMLPMMEKPINVDLEIELRKISLKEILKATLSELQELEKTQSLSCERELKHIMDTIHREQLTIDGDDKQRRRTSAILQKPGKPLDNDEKLVIRKTILERELKGKESELQEIENILQGTNIKELLKNYKENHPEEKKDFVK